MVHNKGHHQQIEKNGALQRHQQELKIFPKCIKWQRQKLTGKLNKKPTFTLKSMQNYLTNTNCSLHLTALSYILLDVWAMG